MNIASLEYKGGKKTTKKTTEVKPDWFDKDIEENEASEDEIKELEELLNI